MAKDFENDLRQALARVSPPDGFTERVLERLSAAERRKSRLHLFLAIAATIALLTGLVLYRYHQEQERTQKAQQQLAFALRLTEEKLMIVETRLKKSARHLRLTKEKL